MRPMGARAKTVGGHPGKTVDTPRLVGHECATFPVLELLAYLQPLVEACVARDVAELDLIEVAVAHAEGVAQELADIGDVRLLAAEQGQAELLYVLWRLRDLQRGPAGEDTQHRQAAMCARRARETLGRSNRDEERVAAARVAQHTEG